MNAIPDQTPLTKTLCSISNELASANTIYPEFHSNHEAAAVIREEYEEYWDEVKLCKGTRPNRRMIEELTQLAAMCVKEILRATDANEKPWLETKKVNPWSLDK